MRRAFRVLSAFIAALAVLLEALTVSAVGTGTPLPLTPDEANYVSTHKSVKIGYVQDRTPVSFTDDSGEFAGISRYIFDYVSELCGIEFEYVPLPAGDVTYDYLLGEGLDLVSSVEYNKENLNARGILISAPYLSSQKVVVARDGLNFSYDANLTIAISTGSQTLRKVLGAAYPNFSLVDYPSTAACFDAVNSGEADLMIQNQYVAEYWLAKPIYEKLKVIPVLGLEDQLCFSAVVAFGGGDGTSEEDGRTLINILNKAIGAMTEDEVGIFTIQGIMDNQYRFNVSDFMYRYRYAVTGLAITLFIILILMFLLIRLYIRYSENKADAKVRSGFLSSMSHEIRTPLNGLIGLNHLMAQNIGDESRLKNYLRQSDVTANYLLSLMNDMLDMSNLQTGNLTLKSEPVDLELVLGTVGSIAENAMSEKNITYIEERKLTAPYVLGDSIRIQQILLNLLDNARKFTPAGGSVTLSVEQETKMDGKILTTAVVADNGRGMSEDFQKHIFETFAQELDTVSKGNQGTGLGLPISRRLAKLMDGELNFVSQKGEGSTFVFTFTAQMTEPPKKDKPELRPVSNIKRTRVLVAEDNELNGEIILELLREDGFEADLAEDGKKALEMFSKSKKGTYGVILMDLLMPKMDGFEAAKAIRALKRPDAKTVRIFACTANSSDEDRRKAKASGMDDFITKPVDVDKLLEKIGE